MLIWYIIQTIINLNNNEFVEYMVDIELILLTQKNNDENGKNQADLDFNKNYPNTVIENRNILKRYLEILKIYNVKSTLVVCST